MNIKLAITCTKTLVVDDKYNSRMNRRTTFTPATKASAVRLMQMGVTSTTLAKELGLTETLVRGWKCLYKDFDLVSDEGYMDFLGMFDGRQLKHTVSQQRTNYAETRRVVEKVKVKVAVTRETSVLDNLKLKLKMHQEVVKKHQAEVDNLTKKITLVAMAEELGLDVEFK